MVGSTHQRRDKSSMVLNLNLDTRAHLFIWHHTNFCALAIHLHALPLFFLT